MSASTLSTDARTADRDAAGRRPAAMLRAALVLLALFVVVGVAMTLGTTPFVQPLDDWWRGVVGAAPDSSLYHGPVPMFFQYLGELPGAIVAVVVIPLLLVLVGRWRSALFFLSSYAAMTLATQVVKNLVDRPRPAPDAAAGLYGPLFKVDHGSFPSGHAAAVGLLVVSVAALIPSGRGALRRTWWVIGALLMVGIVWQRTLVNAHWLSDTLTGLVAGAGCGLLIWWAYRPGLQQDYGRPVWFVHRAQAVAR
jgi:undecaprenyl-diphosphatase